MATDALQERLRAKLFDYICNNNPELLFQLEKEGQVTTYLHGKVSGIEAIITVYKTEPDYILEERCMLLLTKDLRPSKYNYICRVLEEEFATTYYRLLEWGTIKYEAVNLIHYCDDVFGAMHFREASEENSLLYYAIAGAISEYFDTRATASERPGIWHTTAGKN